MIIDFKKVCEIPIVQEIMRKVSGFNQPISLQKERGRKMALTSENGGSVRQPEDLHRVNNNPRTT